MGEQTIYEAAKLAVVGIFSGGIAVLKFSSKYQTKDGCDKAHIEYEKLQLSRRETSEAKLNSIHNSVERIEKLVNKMAYDIYQPRTERTRKDD